MKFYQAEMEAFDFMKGYHNLKEWASYGFNKVVYNGTAYYDGLKDGYGKITEEENEEAGLLTWDYKDYDEDGYMFLVLKRVEEEK